MLISYASFLAHDVQCCNFFLEKKDARLNAKEGIQVELLLL